MILLLLFIPFSLFSSTIGDAGTIVQYALPVTALGMTAYHLDREGNIQFIKAFAASELIKESLKHAVNRRRPNGGSRSFPSGHTSCSFVSSAFIQRRYGWKYGIPAYLAATFVGFSRIHEKAHWPSDVAAGAALGIGLNLLITTPYCVQAVPIPHGAVLVYENTF